MATPAQRTDPEPRLVRVRASGSSDYADFLLRASVTTFDYATEVPLTLPAEAVEEGGGSRPVAGLRPAVLLRRLAGDLARNGKPALRRWLEAAEESFGPMPEDGAAEMVRLWHKHWDLLDISEKNEALGELLDQWDREDGVEPDEEAIAAALERMTVEVSDDWVDEDEDLEFEDGVDAEE